MFSFILILILLIYLGVDSVIDGIKTLCKFITKLIFKD